MSRQINTLMESLQYTPKGPLFNPWYASDQEHDISRQSPDVRRQQLKTYLKDRLESAKYICIGEALGYQGGHFTGIAMTSERILLGYQKQKHGIPSNIVFRNLAPQRTSQPDVSDKGFSEPTATIMWKALLNLDMDPFEVVLWNALPWHPYDPDDTILSNRTPTNSEFEEGRPILEKFLDIFGDSCIIAVGRKAEECLRQFSISFDPVRHPAHGGAPKFRQQMKEIARDTG